MSKHILITGGTGYIGSHTALELLAAGYKVTLADNFANSSKVVVERLTAIAGREVPFVHLDIADTAALGSLLDDQAFDGVIHFAAFKAVGESVAAPLKYYQNNVANFIGLLQTLLDHSIYNFVFSSSAAVYGNPPTPIITEETPCVPASPYGQTKLMDELILHDICAAEPRLKGVALRYFNVVGAHESGRLGEQSREKPQNILPIIIQAAAGITSPLTVYGTDYPTPDGTCQRDYIHVVDLARAHVKALDKIIGQERGAFDVYNVGTGRPTSVLELITAFEKVNGIKVPHTLGERRPGDPAVSYAVVDKANRELGWKAVKTVEDAVRDSWAWQQYLQA